MLNAKLCVCMLLGNCFDHLQRRDLLTVPHAFCSLPGADSHLVWVVDVRAAVAAVTLPEAVVVHTVVARLLLLAVGVPDDGQTALHRSAEKIG